MAKIDVQNGIPSVRFKEQGAAPAAPAAGFHQLYNRAGDWYSQDSTPTESPFGGGGGGVVPPDGAYLAGTGTLTAPAEEVVTWSTEFYDTSLYFDSVMFGDTVLKIPTGKGALFYASVLATLAADDADTSKECGLFIDDGFGPPRKVKQVQRHHNGTDTMCISLSVIFPAFEGDEIFVEVGAADVGSIAYDVTILLQRLAALPIGRGTGTGGSGTGGGP